MRDHALPAARMLRISSRWPRRFSARPICGAAGPASGSTARAWCNSPLEAAGHAAPRDADMQAAELGDAIDWREGAALRRGDLVFWEGHVGIMTSAADFLHANAHHMAVEIEPFARGEGADQRGGL